MDPATATILAATIAAAAQGGSTAFGMSKEKKAAKRKSKEMKRETRASLLSDALQRNAELEGHRLSSRAKMGKASTRNLLETANTLREAFNI